MENQKYDIKIKRTIKKVNMFSFIFVSLIIIFSLWGLIDSGINGKLYNFNTLVTLVIFIVSIGFTVYYIKNFKKTESIEDVIRNVDSYEIIKNN